MHEVLLELDNVTAGYAQDIDVLREVSQIGRASCRERVCLAV